MVQEIIVISGIISGICYRFGGSAKRGNWLDIARHRWVRGAICPLLALLLYIYLKGFHLSFWWAYLAFYGLSYAAISTYWDFLCGFDNHWLHGFFLGLASIPLYWVGVHWWAILIRTIACAVLIGAWSAIWKWDIAEEWGRGFIFTVSVWLLCI